MADPSSGLRASVRAFIALPLPDEVRDVLIEVRNRLEAESERNAVRWVGPDNLHLTLKFLGATPEERLPAIAATLETAASSVRPPSLRLGPLGAFPSPNRPRVFWAGLEGDVQAIGSFYAELEQGLAKLDIPPDARPFSPHITLGRAREGAPPPALQRLGVLLPELQPPALVFNVREVVLFGSILRPGGPLYTRLAVSALGGDH